MSLVVLVAHLTWVSYTIAAETEHYKNAAATQFITHQSSLDAKKNKFRVALFLPLTGDLKALGEDLLVGFQVGAFQNKTGDIQYDIYDTQGTAAGAEQALDQCIHKGADVILGPLTKEATRAIKGWSQFYNIPLISLSNDNRLQEPRALIFGITPKNYVESLFALTQKQNYAEGVAILPQNFFGRLLHHHIQRLFQGLTYIHTIWVSGTDKMPQLTRSQIKEIQQLSPQYIWMPKWGERGLHFTGQLKKALERERVPFIGTEEWGETFYRNDPSLVGALYLGVAPKLHAYFKGRVHGYSSKGNMNLMILAFDLISVVSHLLPHHPKNMLQAMHGYEFNTMFGRLKLEEEAGLSRTLSAHKIERNGKVSPL